MNLQKYTYLVPRLAHRLMIRLRRLTGKTRCYSIGVHENSVQRIYVINLDRHGDRWRNIQYELDGILSNLNRPLTELTSRFVAVEARELVSTKHADVENHYSLQDQLFVEPNNALESCFVDTSLEVEMTRQEIAVALSHIGIWRKIARGNDDYSLILEDDIYFHRNFAVDFDASWTELTANGSSVDLFYVSYQEVRSKADKVAVSKTLFRPRRGLWQLSGYVLSKTGAHKLLQHLPVRGPVDLWINQQFEKLAVFATTIPIIHQRRDYQSSNSYSILPILSSVGVLNCGRPPVFAQSKLPRPIFAFGEIGTGVASLAEALSMLGYRCYSNLDALPSSERDALKGRTSRIFDAYVNVGELDISRWRELAALYPEARFIITDDNTVERSSDDLGSIQNANKILRLDPGSFDKLASLCAFLGCERPLFQYPICEDRSPLKLANENHNNEDLEFPNFVASKHDSLPWIIPPTKGWNGFRVKEKAADLVNYGRQTISSTKFLEFDASQWKLLNDTFPSNLALFTPNNFSIEDEGVAKFHLRVENAGVRKYTSASISSVSMYRYGWFTAEMKPSNVRGLISGIFLHRNSPRQEIDIEFLGKEPTKVLLNVYYNPGDNGATIEYGYRGTPVIVDLGFDASQDFHRYTIEWDLSSIRWLVDDRVIHERLNWSPTPIPDLPMRFYANLWPCRSRELAGRLRDSDLPAATCVRSITLDAFVD